MPGAALAVIQAGQVVHAKGYGWADREAGQPVKPDSLFRIASLSKPITAVATLQLVEEGKLTLADHPFELLELADQVPAGKELDPRWREMTVAHLLQHTGGWDRSESFDPMFRPVRIAQELKAPSPADSWSVIRYMLGQPLDFDPGERYAYSNFGYCLLGRVIERVTKEGYETRVRRSVLAPLGITTARVGESRRTGLGEVHYYMPANSTVPSVFDPNQEVPRPYGGFYLEAMDSHGGWIASAPDLARLASAVVAEARVLRPETLRLMSAPPEGPPGHNSTGEPVNPYYGCGWRIRQLANGKANYWHLGSLPGTFTLLVARHDGVCYAALFNQRSTNRSKDNQIDPWLYQAADQL